MIGLRSKARESPKMSESSAPSNALQSPDSETGQNARSHLKTRLQSLLDSECASEAQELVNSTFSSDKDITSRAAWNILLHSHLRHRNKSPAEANEPQPLRALIDVSQAEPAVSAPLELMIRSATFEPGKPNMPLFNATKTGDVFAQSAGRSAESAAVEECVIGWFSSYLARHSCTRFTPNEAYAVMGWAMRIEPNGEAGAHYHPQALLSAVYYPKCLNQHVTDLSSIEFGCYPAEMLPDRYAEKYCITPTPECVIVFPSHIGHRVLPNKSGKPRISFACDLVHLLL